MDEQSLAHHGIKGQKWGVRRFQNADGSLTDAGRKHYGVKGERKSSENGLTDSQKETLKKVGKAALIAGSVAAAGYLYANNSEAINSALKEISSKSMSSVETIGKKGKSYLKYSIEEAKKGAKEGLKELPKEATKNLVKGIGSGVANGIGKVASTTVEGATIIGALAVMEKALGQNPMNSTKQAYNAYNKKKKIGQVGGQNKDEDDDDE